MNYRKALVLAPHTDDGELGCGATISRLLREGTEVFYVAFSSCRDSLPKGMPEDTLIKELFTATNTLGINKENVRVLDYSVRHFEKHRQEILDSLIELKKEINPDIVFSPSLNDIHQDHNTIANECLRAFKNITIMQYEVPWNNYKFNNQLFVCVDDVDVERKIKAIACYKTQSERSYTREEFTRGQLIMHGIQGGTKYAEVYEIPRMII